MVFLKERKEPLGSKKVGFLEKVGSPFRSGRSFPMGKRVGSPRRVVFPEETLWPWTMMSLGIGCNTVKTRKWGFLGHYRGCFSCEGMGMGPKERFVSAG